MKTIAYTIAIDSPGESRHRNLAKLLASSVIRSGFAGTMVIFHNSPQPLFSLARSNIREEFVEISSSECTAQDTNPMAEVESRWSLKHQVGLLLLEEYEWDRLLFLDADCLVTGSLDALLFGDWQLAVYREPGQPVTSGQFNCFLSEAEMTSLETAGINSGIFCVDRSVSKRFFNAWRSAESLPPKRRKNCLDQAALNRVVLDHDLVIHDFSSLVSMPFHTDTSKARGTAVTHWIGGSPQQKMQASFGLFMETYFFDPSLTLFNLLES